MKYLKSFEVSFSLPQLPPKPKPKFNIGDYVVCVNDDDSDLKEGNLYQISNFVVSSIQGVFYSLKDDLVQSEWMESRFREATEEDIDQNKYNL